MFSGNEFRFLNAARRLDETGWDDPKIERLWRYNLHYFDDLNAIDAVQRTSAHDALITRWIAENPPGVGTGWEPYPTSLRLVNWTKWLLSGNSPPPGMVQSLAVQARWLARRLEHHLLGNHLFANAKALVFASGLFDGPESQHWFDRGLAILAREIPEQILADGGQFELSTMYHAIALEDLLDLINLQRSVGRQVPDDWPGRINSMLDWLDTMTHPDGEIAFFNDAAFGIASSPAELHDYAVRLNFPPRVRIAPRRRHLAASGYVRLQNERAMLLIDVARVGPDYLAGHAHADSLSFELSLDGHRVLVNSGTSVYGSGPERHRQRGTAAHNTVVVDGENSSEVWSGFRVARRARPVNLVVDDDAVSCSHDGYARLSGKPLHWRNWRLADDRLTVTDRVEGSHSGAIAAYHFHPALLPSVGESATTGTLALGGQRLLRWQVTRGTARLDSCTWHPEFGLACPTSQLLVTLDGGVGAVEFSWAD